MNKGDGMVKDYVVAVDWLRHPKDAAGVKARREDKQAKIEWATTLKGQKVPAFVIQASPYLIEQGRVIEAPEKVTK